MFDSQPFIYSHHAHSVVLLTTTKTIAKIAVYGATDHTGGYLLTELKRRGITPILVGRDASRMRAAAAAAGVLDAEIRVATLSDHDALVAAFTGADAVISSLSAYVHNGEPVLAAAIAAGAHYTEHHRAHYPVTAAPNRIEPQALPGSAPLTGAHIG
ncbi:saccharopine dehydrogenase NADP-binding domain-containing protein [Nocardia sp. CA-107356]|uniref:saccharopine dehydrogenase NADP-binding domain-containing protein n=1 Tax=Nocardia sp. CA-107356 TaxID=3239972 RepID=UPI003D8A729D